MHHRKINTDARSQETVKEMDRWGERESAQKFKKQEDWQIEKRAIKNKEYEYGMNGSRRDRESELERDRE